MRSGPQVNAVHVPADRVMTLWRTETVLQALMSTLFFRCFRVSQANEVNGE